MTTTINVATSFNKTFGDEPFALNATSNSPMPFNYSSSDTTIAVVNQSGLVTILKSGVVTITISQNSGYGYNYGSVSTIINIQTLNTSITVNPFFNKTFGDNPFNLGASSNSTMPFNYFSSDPTIATVNESGIVTILKNGTTTITILQNSNDKYTDGSISTTIYVERATTVITCPTINTIFGATPFYMSSYVNSNSPAPFSYEYYRYTIPGTQDSTPIVATVDPASGLITTVNNGNGTIKISQIEYPGFTSNELIITINVEQQETIINVSSVINKNYGDSPFYINASSNSPALMTYSSSNHSVAIINNEGLVTLQGSLGETIITILQNTTDGYTSGYAQSTITVSPQQTVINVNSVFDITTSSIFNLQATSNNNVTSIEYTSTNTNVANVYPYGTVVPVNGGYGTTTINLYQPAGGGYTAASASTTINYYINNTIITVDSTFNKILGEPSFNLEASSNSPAVFNYLSSNPSVATVDINGVVTILSVGTSEITISQNADLPMYGPASAITTINVTPTDGLTYFSTDNAATYTSVNVVGELTQTIVQNNGGLNLTNVIIGSNVTSIGNNAFYYCSLLVSVSIPDSVITIGNRTFWLCSSLTSITIPNSVTTIGDSSFRLCSSLTTISISENLTSIGNRAFSLCNNLTSFYVDNNNINYSTISGGKALTNKLQTILIQYAIGNTNSSYIIPNSITSIGDYAFSSCSNLTNIFIPNSVMTIGANAFELCTNLVNILIPNNVTVINDNTFYSCTNLVNITIGEMVTTIRSDVFRSCTSLTTITIPNSVTFIGNNAFYSCTNLENVNIGEGLTTIQNRVFNSCNNLSNITFNGLPSTITSVGSYIFNNISPNGTRTFTFNNTSNESQINSTLLDQIKAIVDNQTVSTSGPQIFIVPNEITTQIVVPSSISKTYGDIPFNLNATSNSPAPFIYSSSDDFIATVNNNGLITIVNNGTAIITTSQNAISGYTDASANTILIISSSTPENPVIIQDGTEVVYFLTTEAQYATIENNITLTNVLLNTSNNYKNISNGTENTINIIQD